MRTSPTSRRSPTPAHPACWSPRHNHATAATTPLAGSACVS
ncbi:hypothetical protein ACPA9J_04625 [Pseudomonas aeruginosa]